MSIHPKHLAAAVATIFSGVPLAWSPQLARVDLGTHAGKCVTMAISIRNCVSSHNLNISIRESAPPYTHAILLTASTTVQSPVQAITFIVNSTHPVFLHHNFILPYLNISNPNPILQSPLVSTSSDIPWSLNVAPEMAIHAAAAVNGLVVRSIRTVLVGRWEIIFANSAHPNMCVSFHSNSLRTFCRNSIIVQSNYPNKIRLSLLTTSAMRWASSTSFEIVLNIVFRIVHSSIIISKNTSHN
jgi:hypothetical protein